MNASSGDFLRSAALAGLGITVLPAFVAWRDIEAGLLVPVMSDYVLPARSAYAVYPQTRHLSLRVRAFIDFLVERFSGIPEWEACLQA